jgi:hypothetical protein
MHFTMPSPKAKAAPQELPETYELDRVSWERFRDSVRELCQDGLDRCRGWSRKHRGKIPCIQDDIENVLGEIQDLEFEMTHQAKEEEYCGARGGERSLIEDLA